MADAYPFREDQYDDIGGVALRVNLRWSERLERWYADVFDGDGNPIVRGRAVNSGYSLIYRQLDARLPPGELFCAAIDGDLTPPDLERLGAGVLIVYIDPADLPPTDLPTDAIDAQLI